MNPWLVVAAANGLVAVAAGALGAHALPSLAIAHARETVEIAARYQMYHALAIGLASLVPRSSLTRLACVLFLAGIVLFCGSLYLLVLTGRPVFALITPVGGANFLAGWAALGCAGLARTSRR